MDTAKDLDAAMCYEFSGLKLLTTDWLNTFAGLGTLAATVGIAVIAHRFQKDQAISAAFAASEHQQIRINRVLFRLRNAAETLIATQQTSNDASYLPQNGAARFLVALLKSQRLAIEGVKFSDDELAAIGPTRSLLLIELEERGRVLASACGTVIEEVENSNSTAGAATFAISRVKENGDFGQYILTRYNALGQPHT